MEYQGSTATILNALRSAVKAYRMQPGNEELQRIVTFKVGALPPNTVFPALCILPEYEEVTRFYSGRLALIRRSFTIDIYTKINNFDLRGAQAAANNIGEKLAVLFKKAFTLETNESGGKKSFDLQISEVMPNSPVYDVDVIVSSRFTLVTLSTEQLPPAVNKGKDLVDNPTTEQMMQLMFNAFVAEQKGDLKIFRLVAKGGYDDSVVINFPALLIEEGVRTAVRREAGRDRETLNFNFWVCCKMLPDSKSIFFLMELVEAVKKFLWVNESWNGHALQSLIGRISYTLEQTKHGYVYVAQVPYTTEVRRVVSFAR